MENNEIMERLLQDDRQQTSKVDDTPVVRSNRDNEVQMSRIRVVTAKYKVYIVLLIIFICALFIFHIPSAQDSLNASNTKYSQVSSQLNTLEMNIKIANDDINYLCDNETGLVKNEKNLVNCLNNGKNCNNLPESWKTGTGDKVTYNSIPSSYLQLHSLYNKKMPVDEKKVLKNLNEYLIKQNISGEDKDRVGDILTINIGDPKQVKQGDNHFFSVNIDVDIEFQKIGDLIDFLYNVEKKMIENGEDRILYKIQSVSYDIITNNEPQITHLSMLAYYYHDERFDDKTECKELTGNVNSDGVDNNEENIDESDSFLQKIFDNFKK